ncbi:BPSS1780 family membrane protein [Herbaspirillum sp. RTI4]|uniref:BPSS1780 family membrane protein n=1 Tax=Herbaspirillum sp. RTI4 TaxID=3048640 RepID=UPI002AB4F2B2|nr:BPSS1780 family membrane protein [Herbaspirillum sp. RTI4]MDY7577566.1 BPSS1780 family membrane protein [Herbaspirillum sp. RTI4]MEA9981041.1 BPSS1780 family membrane protein [Herbaspirillum sp. RTI4]
MQKLPASTGWLWIKQGVALFRKQPAELSTLFLAYMFLMLVIGIIPVLGQLLPLILVPVFAIAFMQACANIEKGERVYPSLLMTGFRSPLFKRLATLGVLYVLAALVAIGASSLVDGGFLWQAMTGQTSIAPEKFDSSSLLLAIITAVVLYIPAAMAFWYAAPLIAWQDMSVGKAIFYSFYTVRREYRAFLVYAGIWIALGVLVPAILSTLVAFVVGNADVAIFVLLPMSIVLTVIMYSSFYPTYKQVFIDSATEAEVSTPE